MQIETIPNALTFSFQICRGGDAAIVQAELLVVIAKKRKKSFASRDEARSKFASRPPFSTFAAESLEAYCTHGFRDIPGGLAWPSRALHLL